MDRSKLTYRELTHEPESEILLSLMYSSKKYESKFTQLYYDKDDDFIFFEICAGFVSNSCVRISIIGNRVVLVTGDEDLFDVLAEVGGNECVDMGIRDDGSYRYYEVSFALADPESIEKVKRVMDRVSDMYDNDKRAYKSR